MHTLWLTRKHTGVTHLLVPCNTRQQAIAYANEYAGLCGLKWRSRMYGGCRVFYATTNAGDRLQIVCRQGGAA